MAALVLAGMALQNAPAENFKTPATIAYLKDITNGAVLLEKNLDMPMDPAGLVKVVTVAVVFEAIRQGRLQLTDKFTVSVNAWKTGGANSGATSMFAKPNAQIAVADLLRGVIIASGTDAAIALAEGIAASEAAFVERMNAYAASIGMGASRFSNATGLAAQDTVATARDLARLAEHMLMTYPQLMTMFSEKEFVWNKVRQYNRNPLVHSGLSGDGFKTGYTKKGGHSLLGSTNRDGQRLVVVLDGLGSRHARTREARRLIAWGYEGFDRVKVFEAGQTIASARVFGGSRDRVGLAPGRAFYLLMEREREVERAARIVYNGPVAAPIKSGDQLARLQILQDKRVIQQIPLFAADTITTGTLMQRATDALAELGVGAWRAVGRRVGLYGEDRYETPDRRGDTAS